MRGKTQLFFITVSIILFLPAAPVFDSYDEYKQGQLFGATLCLVVLPVFITKCIACLHAFDNSCDGPCKWLWICSCWPTLFRYVERFTHWKCVDLDSIPCREIYQGCTCESCKAYWELREQTVKTRYSLAWLHFIQALTESVPCLCLLVFIMSWECYFPWGDVLLSLYFILSLAWSITALKQARETKDEDQNIAMRYTIVFFIWQIFALCSRLLVFLNFAYVFPYHVFTYLAFHWCVLTLVGAIHRREEFREENACAWFFMLITTWIAVHPLLIFATNPMLPFYKNQRLHTIVAIAVLTFENMLASVPVVIKSTTQFSRKAYMHEVSTLLSPYVLGGQLMGIGFCVLFYIKRCRGKGLQGAIGGSVENKDSVKKPARILLLHSVAELY